MRPEDAYSSHIVVRLNVSRARDYISDKLSRLTQPIITIDVIEAIIEKMYLSENRKGLFLRGEAPSTKDFKRYTKQLVSLGQLQTTARYGVYKIVGRAPLSTQEMISLADPYIYVAYLSAMQRWGVTNRQPKFSLFARPNKTIIKSIKPPLPEDDDFVELPIRTPVGHRSLHRVLDRHGSNNIRIIETRYPAETMWMGGEHTRISTQAATFVDMLHRPDLCGGMAHVVQVWEGNIINRQELILTELIDIVDRNPSSILKVRAGYLLSEHLGIQNDAVQSWKRFAARGGSRKLDPDKPYKNVFSEDWMLSLNV